MLVLLKCQLLLTLWNSTRFLIQDELIPYAEIQLNCEQASDWDHTGELGTYRVCLIITTGDCDDGVLVVTANGYETSVQSVGNIEFEAGSSYDLDIALVQGNDPDLECYQEQFIPILMEL